MRIGGFQEFSLIEYPGNISAVVFTQGCNFRCPFCYNPDLVLPERFGLAVDERDILAFLKRRAGALEGVTITGGEPFVQEDLADFLGKVKDMDYQVKINTNGSFPEKLKDVIDQGLVDYVAMDVKAPFDKYSALAGVKVDIFQLRRSIDILIGSGLDHEFRTTVVKNMLEHSDLEIIAGMLKGAAHYRLQPHVFRDKSLDSALTGFPAYSDVQLEQFCKVVDAIIASSEGGIQITPLANQ